MFKIIFSTILLVIFSQSTYANIKAVFIEGAPKDKFVLSNTSECDLHNIDLTIDLSKSVGALVFDTKAMGKGVEVFQPFEVTKGNIKLTSADQVDDGATKLSLNIETIPANNSVSFTIDVDDTLTKSQSGNIIITGSEIENALLTLENKGSHSSENISTASFNMKSIAVLAMPECKS